MFPFSLLIRRWVGTVILVAGVGVAFVGPAGALAGVWSAPRRLSAVGQVASDPELRSDASGDMTAVWQQQRSHSNASVIVVSQRSHWMRGWTRPLDISGGVPGGARGPRLAMNSAGAAVVVWEAKGGLMAAVRGSASDRWSRSMRVPSGFAVNPVVAIDARRVVTVAWSEYRGPLARQTQLLEASTLQLAHHGRWARPRVLARGGGAIIPSSLQLACDPAGQTVLLWVKVGGAPSFTSRVYTAVRPSVSAAWGPAASLGVEDSKATNGMSTDFGPRLALDAQGDAVAVWQGPGSQAAVAVFAAHARSWQHVRPPSDQPALFPQVASSPRGEVTMSWQALPGGVSQLFLSPSSVRTAVASKPILGARWSEPVTFAPDPRALVPGQIPYGLRLAVAPSGAAILSWLDNGVHLVARPTSLGHWERPVVRGDNGAGEASIAFVADGGAQSVWQETRAPTGPSIGLNEGSAPASWIDAVSHSAR